jgi:hypothetical protein
MQRKRLWHGWLLPAASTIHATRPTDMLATPHPQLASSSVSSAALPPTWHP